MNINCIICSELFVSTPTDEIEIYIANCGHLFHFHCIVTWLERKKACPQCRAVTTKRDLHKVYFSFTNTDGITDDVGTLQYKLENANSELLSKGRHLENVTENNERLLAQNGALRGEVKELEEKLRSQQSSIYALKEQVVFFKNKSKELQRVNKELAEAKQKLHNFEKTHMAITGTRDEINEMLRQEKDVDTLVLLAATLKKTLMEAERKQHEAESRLRRNANDAAQQKREVNRLELENAKLRLERDDLIKQFEQEKAALRNKLSSLNSKSPSVRRMIEESPVPVKRKAKPQDYVDLNETTSPAVPERVKQIKDSDSPYLTLKSSNMGIYPAMLSTKLTSHSQSSSSKYSIFKPPAAKLSDMKPVPPKDGSVSYNGLGGSSKTDIFPSPKPKPVSFKRSRPTTLVSSSKFRKIAKSTGSTKLNEFLNRSQ